MTGVRRLGQRPAKEVKQGREPFAEYVRAKGPMRLGILKVAVMIPPAVQQANWCCRVALFSFGPECAIHQRARTATYKAIAFGLPEGRRLWLCLLPLFSGLAGLGSLRLLGLKKRAESVSVCGCERHVLHISVHVRY